METDVLTTSNVCQNCGASPEGSGYSFKLCSNCRNTLSNRPLPILIKCCAVFILALLIGAVFTFSKSFEAGIQFERGRKAELSRDYIVAVEAYGKVVAQYPESTLALARLGVANYHAGNLYEAISAFKKIAGRKASSEIVAEVNRTLEEIEAKVK
jgi:tetratricopeptide (TPR) repeat protein